MKIRVREITNAGLEVEVRLLPKDLGLNEDFVSGERPVTISGMLTRVDDIVVAGLDVSWSLVAECARCLGKIQRDIAVRYNLEFVLEPGDEYVDVGRAVHDEILIDYQVRLLCREDCQGICAGCGALLNNEKCMCL